MQRYEPDSPGGGRWPPPDIEGVLRDLGERFRGLDGRRVPAGGGVGRTGGPGLPFKVPYGVEKVRLVPTARVLKEEFGFRTSASIPGQRTQYADSKAVKGESQMLTGGLNVIDVQGIGPD